MTELRAGQSPDVGFSHILELAQVLLLNFALLLRPRAIYDMRTDFAL